MNMCEIESWVPCEFGRISWTDTASNAATAAEKRPVYTFKVIRRSMGGGLKTQWSFWLANQKLNGTGTVPYYGPVQPVLYGNGA